MRLAIAQDVALAESLAVAGPEAEGTLKHAPATERACVRAAQGGQTCLALRLKRPSPAMVVALIALFVALAGSGYAAVTINGKNLKNRSVAGKKLMRNTVGGTEVNESRLGRVPSAANANLLAGLAPSAFLPAAGKAADADKLDGQDSTAFLGAAAKAADADKLDGQDSTAFLGAAARGGRRRQA